MDSFDLLAVLGTLKSLLQHHSSKASILWHSAFFIVQLSHPYMTTRHICPLFWILFFRKDESRGICCFKQLIFALVLWCLDRMAYYAAWFRTHILLWDRNRNPAAAAKSLQSCPTLCSPIDGSPPGSPVPGILQARTLEWVAISFSNA